MRNDIISYRAEVYDLDGYYEPGNVYVYLLCSLLPHSFRQLTYHCSKYLLLCYISRYFKTLQYEYPVVPNGGETGILQEHFSPWASEDAFAFGIMELEQVEASWITACCDRPPALGHQVGCFCCGFVGSVDKSKHSFSDRWHNISSGKRSRNSLPLSNVPCNGCGHD